MSRVLALRPAADAPLPVRARHPVTLELLLALQRHPLWLVERGAISQSGRIVVESVRVAEVVCDGAVVRALAGSTSFDLRPGDRLRALGGMATSGPVFEVTA